MRVPAMLNVLLDARFSGCASPGMRVPGMMHVPRDAVDVHLPGCASPGMRVPGMTRVPRMLWMRVPRDDTRSPG